MPQYNRRELDARAREYGFNRDTFEKGLRLRTILEFLNTQEYMREHLLLKGGTAINLTVFKLPRLSVDIDLDFIPNLTREETANERERLTEILKGYMCQTARCGRRKMRIVFGDFAAEPRNDFGGRRMLAA